MRTEGSRIVLFFIYFFPCCHPLPFLILKRDCELFVEWRELEMFLPSCCTLIWYQDDDDDDDDNPPLASLPKSHIHRVHEGSWLFGVFEMQGRTGV